MELSSHARYIPGLGMLRIFDFLSLSFSFFSSVGIIHFATISVVYVAMDIFISQDTSRLFIDFLLCFYWGSGARSGGFVLARVCSSCAGVNIRVGMMNRGV